MCVCIYGFMYLCMYVFMLYMEYIESTKAAPRGFLCSTDSVKVHWFRASLG